MKKSFLVLATLIITMLATTMVAFAGSATLKQDAKGDWWYYNNGKLDTTKDGMVDYNGGLFVVIKGVVRKDFMGMCHVVFPGVDKWYFFSEGQVQKEKTGFAMYDNAWFYLNKGELDTTKQGFYDYNGGLFLVADGRIVSEYSGLYQNTQGPKADNKWYFIANGQVQKQYTGLAQYDGEWFYLSKGCLNESYTGYVEYNGGTFYVVNGMVKASPAKYTVADITKDWMGSVELVGVSGAAELQKYLETLYGRSLTSTEIAGLKKPISAGKTAELSVWTYTDDNNVSHPGTWNLYIDMGSFFGLQEWDDWDILTYKEFESNQRDGGCIVLDGNNSFSLSVAEADRYGEYGQQVFNVEVPDNAGAYGLVFDGTVSPGTNGKAGVMEGQFIVTLQYGSMKEPYVAHYKYSFKPY